MRMAFSDCLPFWKSKCRNCPFSISAATIPYHGTTPRLSSSALLLVRLILPQARRCSTRASPEHLRANPEHLRANPSHLYLRLISQVGACVTGIVAADINIKGAQIQLAEMSDAGKNTIEDDYDNYGEQWIEQAAISQFCNILTSSSYLIHDYNKLYLQKKPCMTSGHTGDKWVLELLHDHPIRFYNMFRMSQEIFKDLLRLLETSYGLEGSRRITTREILAISLYILAHNESIRETCERFQHSTETISRYFSRGLHLLVMLGMDIIIPSDKLFAEIPSHIRNDVRYMPYFKNCIGAIDGTHVDARIPVEEQVAFIGRHHSPTQNIMAICDFNMCFTFVASGWEGSAHDARIFHRAVKDPRCNFPSPPAGKYYLVDADYPLQRGFLKPYPETRYHLPDFICGTRPIRGHREIFNRAHSSLRSVIERTFGVWKKKWGILRDMPNYPFKKQRLIVVASMAIHNFIRRHHSRIDLEFEKCDVDECFIHPESDEYRAGVHFSECSTSNIDVEVADGPGAEEMAELRDNIALQLCQANRFTDDN